MKEFYKFLRGSLLVLSFTALLCSTSRSQTLTPRYIDIAPQSHGFYEYLPAGYDPASPEKYPLVVFYHGSGETGDGSTSELPKVLANGMAKLIGNGTFPTFFTVNNHTFSFIVLIPQFTGLANHVDTDSILNYAGKHYNVDLNRIYLTGLSLGGNPVWDYPATSLDRGNRIAAILPVAGAYEIYQSGPENIASAHVPVFATHNLNDPTVPSSWTTTNVNTINSITDPVANPKAIDTIFPASGHDAWTKTYDPTVALHNGLNVYQWMLQYSRNIVPPVLPVKLTAYTAVASGSQAIVSWTTAMEENNRYFIVQRSTDGQEFTNIDTTAPAGRSGGGASYSYTDNNASAGANFYRLVQVDLDGNATYFDVLKVSVSLSSRNAYFRISPNPAKGPVYLEMANAVTGTLQVNLSDIQGRTLRTWNFNKQGLSWTQSIDPGNLPSGIYIINIYGNSYKEVRQFIRK
jgi:predicted esterase